MKRSVMSGTAAVLLSMCSLSVAQEREEDKTLSPYFFVQCENNQNIDMPLLSTSADVNIAGVIADVTVSQVYKNSGSAPIEAIYVFPASTRAAVYALKMEIGERIIEAQIKERQQAWIEYEAAKQEGKSAALLEQQRPNVFQMNVANIMPGDLIKVELRYTELLVPVNNVYEFVYPTVVGPRYSNASVSSDKSTDQWISNPYLKQRQKPGYTFDIKVGVSSGMPIQDMVCGTHKTSIQYDNASAANVSLDKSESDGGNRDFILKYRLAGDKIESGVLLYEGKEENFFCMIMQPPQHVTTANIPPREYIFVVDVSGSMNGFPLEISKELLRNLISGLRQTDCFNVVLFAGGSTVMSPRSLPATKENIAQAINVIDNQHGGGGTELLPALEKSIKLPRGDASSRSIVIVTDGYIGFETEAFELIRTNLDKANLFAFGIGSSVNRFLIDGMAHAGGGEPYVVTSPEKGAEIAETFRKYIDSPVLTQIKSTYNGFSVYDVEPISIPDVMASRPIIVYGKWKGSATGTINVNGFTGNKNRYEETFNIGKNMVSEKNRALRYLWARQKIAMLGDYNKLAANNERIREITSLGLRYNLLTEYTSFIAIDKNIRNTTGSVQTIKQALPLPEGVSDLAVGGSYAPASPVLSSTATEIKRKIMELESGRARLRSCPVPPATKSSGYSYERRKEEALLIDAALKKIQFTDATKAPNNGKVIMFFWNSTIPSTLDEIEAVIKFAVNDRSVKVAIINTEAISEQQIEQILLQVTGKYSLPPNVYFIHDTQGTLSKYISSGTFGTAKSIVSFTENGKVKKCLTVTVALWSNAAKVFEYFK